jgi:hypothetical protein
MWIAEGSPTNNRMIHCFGYTSKIYLYMGRTPSELKTWITNSRNVIDLTRQKNNTGHILLTGADVTTLTKQNTIDISLSPYSSHSLLL